MKKLICIVLTLLFLLSVCGCAERKTPVDSETVGSDQINSSESVTEAGTQEAESTPVSDFIYTVSDNTVTITGYNGSDEVVIIPSYIEGYPVSIIGEEAFSKKQGLKKVILSDTVKEIGKKAFYESVELEEVVMPEGLSVISEHAFDNCTALSAVNLPDTLTFIYNGAFENCTSLKYVRIPAIECYKFDENREYHYMINGRSIAGAFKRSGVEEVDFAEGVEMIPFNMFCASDIKTFIAPSTLLFLGAGAFWGCDKLEKVELNKNLKYMHTHTFGSANSTAVPKINYPENIIIRSYPDE